MSLLPLLAALLLTPPADARGRAATAVAAPAAPADVSGLAKQESATGLSWYVVKAGDGSTVVKGDTVFVHYTGWLADGTRFDSSWERGEPFSYQVGAGRVIKGWDEGVVGMQPGEIRQLHIPAKLGYGASGAGGVIPPDADLVFDVQLMKIRGG